MRQKTKSGEPTEKPVTGRKEPLVDGRLEKLIMDLKDKNWETRRESAKTLGEMKYTPAVDSLIEALKDENEKVRYCAAWALGKIGDFKAVDALINALEDMDRDVKWIAVGALGEIGDTRALPRLIEILKNGDCDLENKAGKTVTEIMKKPDAMKELIEYAQSWRFFNFAKNKPAGYHASFGKINGIIAKIEEKSNGEKSEAES